MRTIHRISGSYRPKCMCNVATEVVAAGIGAAGSIIGAGASAAGQANLNKKNREYAEKQAEIQRQWSEKMYNEQNAWNYEMWQKENEYNSPEAQVQRMRDAGLNPLFYGIDGSSAGDLTAAQPLGYQRATAEGQLNPMAGFSDAALKAAQVANVQAQTEKTKSETGAINAKLPFEVDALKAQVRSSNLSSDAQEIVNKYLDQQQAAELRVKNATAAEADAMVQRAGAEIEKMDYEKTTMYMGWLETQEKILNLQKQRDLTDKQMEELSSLIAKNSAEAKKIGLDVTNYDDITVIGTASHNIKLGPVSVQEGEPITLGMMKAAREHAEVLKEKQNDKKTKNNSYGAMTQGSSYEGPIYD